MDYSFDVRADRSGAVPWLKEYFTPEAVRQTGLLGYAGAEFEFASCPAFIRGVVRAAQKGVFGYCRISDAYRSAVQWWMRELRGYEINPEWVVPAQGTIFSVATAIRLFTEPGDRIIVLPPNYNRYNQAAVRLGRGTIPVPLLEEERVYHVDWTGLEEAFAEPKNKLLVICNPNNPTGHIYRREELERIAALSRQYETAVFSDEIFGEIVFKGQEAVPFTKLAGPDALAVTCTSMGKVFSLTGVNHANVIIENDALRERWITQRDADHFGSVDPLVYAGMLEAFTEEGKQWVFALREYLWENYRILKSFFQTWLPKAVLSDLQGSFVIWVDYSAYGEDWPRLDRLLREEGLFVGDEGQEYYGKPACVRYAIAVPHHELQKTLDRVAHALQSHRTTA